MITLRRVAEEPDAVLELVATGIARQSPSPWFADRGPGDALLHYVDDNELSRPFWSRRSFAPLVVTLAGDVLS